MTKFVSCALAAAFVFCTPFAAFAGDSVKHIAVHYDDLNLTQKNGAEALIARIDVASKEACGGTPDLRDLKMREFFNGCVKATKDQAVASVQAPLVAAVYNGTAPDDAVQVSQR